MSRELALVRASRGSQSLMYSRIIQVSCVMCVDSNRTPQTKRLSVVSFYENAGQDAAACTHDFVLRTRKEARRQEKTYGLWLQDHPAEEALRPDNAGELAPPKAVMHHMCGLF